MSVPPKAPSYPRKAESHRYLGPMSVSRSYIPLVERSEALRMKKLAADAFSNTETPLSRKL